LPVQKTPIVGAADGECLSCGGFSLGETFHIQSLEFIAECFSSLNLAPRGDGSDATFMGSTCSGPPSPLWAMIEDSTEEFHTASEGEGVSNLPSPRRHDVGALLAPVTSIAWLEDTLTTQGMTTIPPWPTAL
jgi:hypothetical protein